MLIIHKICLCSSLRKILYIHIYKIDRTYIDIRLQPTYKHIYIYMCMYVCAMLISFCQCRTRLYVLRLSLKEDEQELMVNLKRKVIDILMGFKVNVAYYMSIFILFELIINTMEFAFIYICVI